MSKASIRHTIGQHVDEVEFEARNYINEDSGLFVKNRDRDFHKDELLGVYQAVCESADVQDPELQRQALESSRKQAIYRSIRNMVHSYGTDYAHRIKTGDGAPLRKDELMAVLYFITEEHDA